MSAQLVNIKSDNGIRESRRRFLNLLISAASLSFLGMIIFPVIRYLSPPKSLEAKPTNVLAAEVSELKNNSGKIFRFGNKPGILIKTPGGEVRAFTAVCTHLECTVQYRADFQHIWCACHNGHFDLNGKNISGPPPSPLERFEVNIKDNKIYVHRKT